MAGREKMAKKGWGIYGEHGGETKMKTMSYGKKSGGSGATADKPLADKSYGGKLKTSVKDNTGKAGSVGIRGK